MVTFKRIGMKVLKKGESGVKWVRWGGNWGEESATLGHQIPGMQEVCDKIRVLQSYRD